MFLFLPSKKCIARKIPISRLPPRRLPNPKATHRSLPRSRHNARSETWSQRDQAFQPRLTRQHKLRHLSDIEIEGLTSNDRHSTRTAFSAHSTSFPCSPSSRGRSSIAPLLLPLPDLSALLRRPDISASSSGRFPLLSPKEVQSTSRDEDDQAENLNGMLSTSSLGCMFSYHFGCKCPEKNRKLPTRSANSLDAKSAPNSGRSSPVRNPRRLSTGDQLAPFYATSLEF